MIFNDEIEIIGRAMSRSERPLRGLKDTYDLSRRIYPKTKPEFQEATIISIGQYELTDDSDLSDDVDWDDYYDDGNDD